MSGQQLSLGVDLVAVADVAESIGRFGDRYLSRVFTPREREDTSDDPAGLAARFAAKEAVFKALLAGDDAMAWSDVEVVRAPGRAPEVRLAGAARVLAERAGITHVAISMTHDGGAAAAVAVAQPGEA